MTDPAELYSTLQTEAARVLIGQEDALKRLTISLLTQSHLLLEGVPGVAKTTLAAAFAQATGLQGRRIQMTPDLLPADITGTKIYREDTGAFELERGPVFSNLVIADEINRATPKTQSALLEAMQETQVTIEGETLNLPTPFMVVATQNPIEMEGTFGLPEAQRDRFQFKIDIDIPSRDKQAEILDRFNYEPNLGPDDLEQVLSAEDIASARTKVKNVHVAEPVRDYVLDIAEGTQETPDVSHGISPRGSLHLLQAAKAHAAIEGRHYVIPDDVKTLAVSALAHRLVLSTDAEIGDVEPEAIIEGILDTTTPPSRGDVTAQAPAVGDGGRTKQKD
ncbi:MoxR family ATPase [Halogeometricum borinquense]|uniref:MoxR family ATPase n=1 Tax=Halogeometricum borinquense TaxID=60847 RepID=A0A6C0UJ42_9EURY|nr:MoxR family ATPase [Halogeometricum borinquense]QIB75536.1 MoxR family ATPase [Halogeometricum borinquense]